MIFKYRKTVSPVSVLNGWLLTVPAFSNTEVVNHNIFEKKLKDENIGLLLNNDNNSMKKIKNCKIFRQTVSDQMKF